MAQVTTVWIANRCGHPYEDAERFGKLEALTIGDVNPMQVDRLSWHISRGIGKYVKENDYLLVSGTNLVNMLALSLWLTRFDFCNLLIWDAKKQKYRKFTVKVDNFERLLQKALV